jgi:dipeptidyl aminopeptidase/acylaminoacyl peptidase
MGEVYLAHDTRLQRRVAVKVLPAAFADSAERLRRFEQEARATATLNHPNVMAVFDVGVDDGIPYVVSELLEGETLASALRSGALPPRKATDLAVQIAHGLAAAHGKGIVHRDLKPDNIFVTTDGRVKILDFGLARIIADPDTQATVTHLATTPPTGVGNVLGTAGYMAPEQVRGEAADHRADIFAFGVVFYEMLSGQVAFGGDTLAERMTAILKEDPPALPAGAVPPHLDRVVHRCLEKTPGQRFQSSRDIAFALEAMSGSISGTASAPAVETTAIRPAPAPRRWSPLVAAGALAGGIAIGALAMRPGASTPPPVVTFAARTFDRLPITNARFMPDGQTIVYSATPRGTSPELFVINPNAEAPQPLGVSGAHLLSVSRTGELAVIVNPRILDQRLYGGTLARMTIGSSPRAVAEDVREADWAPDGATMAIVRDLGDLRDRLEFPAGTVRHEASGFLSNPRVSPDGQRVAFVEHPLRFDDRGWVKVVDRAGKVTTLTEELFGVQGLAWSTDGATVLFSGNATASSLLQPMSAPASGGAPARAVFGVPARFIVFDVAKDGRWLAVREDLSLGVRARVPGQETERDLSWIGSTAAQALSADGGWLLMVDAGLRGGRNYGVVLRKTDGSQAIRLGEGLAQKLSPDGKWAAAIVAAPAQLVLYPTGAGEAVRLAVAPIATLSSAEWFPDGQRLLVCGSAAARPPRCYGVDRAGSAPVPLTPEGVLATLAPDGRTLLLAKADGSFHLSSIDGDPPRPVQGLRSGDRQIAWSRDSQAIYVQDGFHVPATVERVALATGARSTVRQLAPDGVSPITALYVMDWVDDGRWYAYYYTSLPSTLFVVDGAMH